MAEQDNERVVRELFDSLTRGDLPGVLDRLAEDIEWRIAGPAELGTAGVHRGRDAVAQLLRNMGGEAEFELFEPQDYFARGDQVVVLGRERQRLKASGRVIHTDWAMVFTLAGGKVARFRNFVDTRQEVPA